LLKGLAENDVDDIAFLGKDALDTGAFAFRVGEDDPVGAEAEAVAAVKRAIEDNYAALRVRTGAAGPAALQVGPEEGAARSAALRPRQAEGGGDIAVFGEGRLKLREIEILRQDIIGNAERGGGARGLAGRHAGLLDAQ